jgi:broad specificity phosphatase PhoE
MEEYKKTFYFIRHGETDWNKEFVYQGHIDVPLNDTGRNQAIAQNSPELSNIDIIFSSPLIRAKETATIIQGNLENIDIIELNELMECQSAESAKFILKKRGENNFPSFDKLPESQEGPKDFMERVAKGLEVVLTSKATCPLIVSHGGTGTAICLFLGVKAVKPPNCKLLRFEFVDNQYNITWID